MSFYVLEKKNAGGLLELVASIVMFIHQKSSRFILRLKVLKI